ncbi:MAG: metalloregulator ArsR/SmtB family transcription factor [Actinomycetota bacterium]
MNTLSPPRRPRAPVPTPTPDATLLRALADPTRLAIVERLAVEECCVCHLVEDLHVAQPLVSHHLGVLREAGVIEGERFRYWTYYRLRPDVLGALADAVRALAGATARASRRPCC